MRRGIRRTIVAAVLLLGALQAACTNAGTGLGAARGGITDPTAEVVRSTRGAVASAQPLATEVGARVLAQGGNAVDAAVATAFALAVVEPAMSGLGGRASIVIRAADGSLHGIDGLNQVPASYQGGAPEGYDRAAIPGVPAGLARALEEHGTWSLADVLAPAIELAEEGFVLLAGDAERMAGARDDLLQYEASARYFLHPDGSSYQAGERLVQTDLARALRAIADGGVDVFYHGWIADSIHADMVAHGGFITRDELDAYEALDAIPARGGYRGYDLVSNFRPSSGQAVVQALQMIEEFEVPPESQSVAWASLLGQAMQIAISDRNRDFGTEVQSAQTLTSREYARMRAQEIRLPGPGDAVIGAGVEAGSVGVQPAEVVDDDAGLVGVGSAEPAAPWPGFDRDHTTHLSVADDDGMAVALTQSIGPVMGTRLAASGVGFLYATRLGSTPGSRPSSTIAPTLVLHPDGRLALAVGAAGDSRIISAIIQTISRTIDHGVPLEEAVGGPRVHPSGEAQLRIEVGPEIMWTSAERQALEELGFSITIVSSQDFGRVHAVAFDPATGVFTGAADPRRDGSAAAPGG